MNHMVRCQKKHGHVSWHLKPQRSKGDRFRNELVEILNLDIEFLQVSFFHESLSLFCDFVVPFVLGVSL